ncbi:replicative DNA helicase [Rosistilla oblonga]|uniref:replicative DNA helicase n=1 Tax=Rosistilla oblonga TaxID=2527990 RepID=UPI003A96A44A
MKSETSAEHQESLIGAIILDPTVIDAVREIVTQFDFTSFPAATVFGAIEDLHDSNQPVELVTIVHRLKADGSFKKIGGPAYIGHLSNKGIAHHAKFYATQIRSESRRQKLRAIVGAAAESLDDPKSKPEDAIERLDSQISALLSTDCTIGIEDAYTVGCRVIDEIRDAKTQKREIGLKTGIRPVDEAMRGLQPGSFTVVAARTSVGKTSLAMQIADTAAMDDRHILFVSLEMTAEELLRRNIANDTGIDSRLLANCYSDSPDECITNEEIAAAAKSVKRYEGKPFHIWAPASAGVSEIRRKARIRQAHSRLDLVIVDYLQFIAPRDRRISRTEQIGEMTQALKGLAKELSVPVIAAAQINREGGKLDRPRLCDLAESGRIENDCDNVLILHRPRLDEPATELIIAKQRGGPTGVVPLVMDLPSTTFSELPTSSHQNYNDDLPNDTLDYDEVMG